MKKSVLLIIILIVAGLGFAAYYWLFIQSGPLTLTENAETAPTTFNPLNRPGNPPVNTPGSGTKATSTSSTPAGETTEPVEVKLPLLRQLSQNPIGGFMASSTASSSLVRYFDRATGYVYEARSDATAIDKLSNTTLPRIYESYWNKNLTTAILRYIKDDATGAISNFYAEVRKIPASTSTPQTTPYEIKGKFISSSVNQIAVSPKGDSIFTLSIENDRGAGYTSGFDENKKTKVFDSPLTQLNAAWPELNTIAISTKASAGSRGYLYLVDLKKGITTKALGNIFGFAAKVSPDTKRVLYSSGGANKVATGIYTIANGTDQSMVFKTLAEKCSWSKLHPDEAYCAVPIEIPSGVYPDDWYKGNVSFTDQIWHVDAITGEVHLVANLVTLGNALIDATQLTLDPKENYLYFVNKRDLTLWSLSLDL